MNLYKCKGYNAWQFITEFSEQRLDKEQHQQAAGEVRNSQHGHTDKNVDTVESLLLSQEDKPQSHRTVREISREAGDPSVISFADYSQRYASQVLQEKARSTADRSAQHAHVMDKKNIGVWGLQADPSPWGRPDGRSHPLCEEVGQSTIKKMTRK